MVSRNKPVKELGITNASSKLALSSSISLFLPANRTVRQILYHTIVGTGHTVRQSVVYT